MRIDPLIQALSQRGFEKVQEGVSPSKIVLMGRVPKNVMSSWLLTVRHALIQQKKEHTSWSAKFLRQYMVMSPPEYTLLYAHMVILEGANLEESMAEIVSVISNSPRPARVEMTSYPLHANPNRNVLPNGGGVRGTDGSNAPPMLRGGRLCPSKV